jgi:hypothetical protein
MLTSAMPETNPSPSLVRLQYLVNVSKSWLKLAGDALENGQPKAAKACIAKAQEATMPTSTNG